MNRFPIQTAKVQRPPLPAGILRRERLLDWLDTKVHSRVVLVTAEAGYGKTTTLADWSRRTRVRTLWYRLDEDDANWVSFLNYLVAAGREVDAGFAPNTGALLREMGTGGATRDTIVDSFLRELPMLVATAPLAMVFDDMHLVDGSSDVRLFFRDLLARVPERLTVIVLGRRTPNLSLARLRGRGEVAELRTDDLRFDVAETEQLFRDAYHQPLEPDVLAELNRRTEGWAASLQLVQAAIRGRTTAETRAFVRSLSSAQGALYDYLAEEVVGDLAPELQQLLMRTSILQQVDVELAALVADVDEASAHRLMDSAETLGLLSGRAAKGEMARYHPLVRDFLEARLRRDEGDDRATALHLRVARHAEGRNWRLAAYHYCAISEFAKLQSVLAQATGQILGGGDFALAESYVLQLPSAVRRVEFDIVASRMELHRGRLTVALELARSAVAEAATTRPVNDEVSALTLFNLATLEFLSGNVDTAVRLARDIEGSGAAIEIKEVARAFISINEATLDRNLDGCAEELTALSARHEELGLDRFYAITSLNLANVQKARGIAAETLAIADRAVDALVRSGSVLELPSAHSARAWALAFMGRWPEAEKALQAALDSATDLTRPEATREAADIQLLFGSATHAFSLLEELIPDGGDSLLTSPTSPDQELLLVSLGQTLLRLDRAAEADAYLSRASLDRYTTENAHRVRVLTALAELATAQGRPDAASIAQEAIARATAQSAGFLRGMASCVLAIHDDAAGLSTRLVNVARSDPSYLTTEAFLIVRRLDELSEAALVVVSDEARRRPDGWRIALRQFLSTRRSNPPVGAAVLLNEIGELQDVPLLRETARRNKRHQAMAGLGLSLARRLAPRVLVEDLGRVSIRIGSQIVQGTDVRRKSLALLCYLITMPSMAASRDQVLDALWPDVEPDSALNSLNQTIYFLRRVFEPAFTEDASPGYIHHDADVIWLDPDLITSRSSRCRDLIASLGDELDLMTVRGLAEEYQAPFALDFMYEDWAAPFRSSLHAAFLEVVEKALYLGLESGRYREAITVARHALGVDPDADQVELSLLRLFQKSGAHAAAAEQYGHYANVMREELGVEPPALDGIVAEQDT